MPYLSASLDELSCVKVVEYILDRNACLLPAYFAVTEIRKLYPEGALSHWVTHSWCRLSDLKQLCYQLVTPNCASLQLLGSLISDFVDSFRPTARINSICGKMHSHISRCCGVCIPWAPAAACHMSEYVSGRCNLLPVVNNSGAICNSWKLDPTTLRFPLRGMLPYDKVPLLNNTRLMFHPTSEESIFKAWIVTST